MFSCRLEALIVVASVFLVRSFDFDGCTSMIVGSGATVDGSAMASHANDCVDCDWRVVYIAAKDHAPGAMRTVYDTAWGQYPRLVDTSRSSLYTAGAGIESSTVLGEIPQVPHTYALWEASYGLMNEHGLGLGESTCPGFLIGKGVTEGGTAIFSVGNLMNVALERCKTARCAVQTMGDLGAQFGFYGEDPGLTGAGEAVTVVDKAGEAWVFHITAGVDAKPGDKSWAGQRGALWVAQRVPDGHVAVVANSFIIKEVDISDTENFMVHPGLLELTKEAGLYSGSGPFHWQQIMSPDLATFQYFPGMAPIPMYSTLRLWGVYRQVAPSLGLKPSKYMQDFPFSVQVDKKVTHLDVMSWFRDHYEGTEFDMTLGALAGPWRSPNRNEGGLGQKPGVGVPGQITRSNSITRTSYTAIMQSGIPQPVAWFAADQSSTSVFVPFFSDVLAYGGGKYDVELYGMGSMKSFSFGGGKLQPAWWAFDFVSNYMELSYHNMSLTYVYPKRDKLQLEVDTETKNAVKSASLAATLEDKAAALGSFQTKTQRKVVEQWWSLAELLVVRYNDGFFNFGELTPKAVAPIGYPAFWLEMVGFGQTSYMPTWFSKTAAPPSRLTAVELAQLAPAENTVSLSAQASLLPSPSLVSASLPTLLALFIGLAGGYVLGLQGSSTAKAREAAGGYVRVEP